MSCSTASAGAPRTCASRSPIQPARFLIVTSPERAAVDEALFFATELDRAGMHRAGVIVNRVHPFDTTDLDVAATATRLAPVLGSSLAERTARTHAQVQRLAQRDAAAIARLHSALHDEPVSLDDRPSDVHGISGLAALYEELFERDDSHGTHRQIAHAAVRDGEDSRPEHG
jgi:anion-transporting  ArsA/GET3 family ATPase